MTKVNKEKAYSLLWILSTAILAYGVLYIVVQLSDTTTEESSVVIYRGSGMDESQTDGDTWGHLDVRTQISPTPPDGYQKLEVRADPLIETDYPDWFAPWYTSTHLHDWLPLLDEQDRDSGIYIVVPRFGMIAPIWLNQEYSQQSSLDIQGFFGQLEDWLIQHPWTELPWEIWWNFVVAGHTSNGKLFPGRYKTVFQFLPLLQKGDIVYVYLKDDTETKRYTYEIYKSERIEAASTSILGKPVDEISLLTLYGCYPFGTLDDRWYAAAMLESVDNIYHLNQ